MKYYIETYGCQMNLSDSELITTILDKAGHSEAEDLDQAELIIFNTCSVRQHAEDRVLGRISCERARKTVNSRLKIAVVGCMAQRMGKSLIEKGIGVDLVVGVDQYLKLPDMIAELEDSAIVEQDSKQVYDDLVPKHHDPHCAFVTIMRGCDNFCSYCIVPHVRGRERSRDYREIEYEVEQAISSGKYDITLLGQNVNSYHYEGVSFPMLLDRLSGLNKQYRLRFITSHPKDLSDELIEVMARNPKISKHIHLPMQSGDSEILERMNRKYDYSHYKALVDKLRRAMPEIAITTDLIAGFPGETEGQFGNTLKAISEIRFDYAFCFKYSNREGTDAAEYDNQVSEDIRLHRLQRMIDLQRQITLEKYQDKIGTEIEVYVEALSRKSNEQVSGKTDDYKIAVLSGDVALIGSFVKAQVIAATAGTLICE